MLEALKRIFFNGPGGAGVGDDGPQRARLHFKEQPRLIYAIGDVHGTLDLLIALEKKIVADAANFTGGEKWIVMLGDYVDRGPDSARVIDHLLGEPPAGFRRFCLMGNHESAMLDFLGRPDPNHEWLGFGGLATLASYGIDIETVVQARRAQEIGRHIASHIPQEHAAFLEKLPVMIDVPGAIFVHAGLRPGVEYYAQADYDLLWYRDKFENDYSRFGRPVIHGHTPRTEPLVGDYRIAIDTGACFSGILSAVRISAETKPKILQVKSGE